MGVVPFNSILEMPLKLGTQKTFITMLKKTKGVLSRAWFLFCFVLFLEEGERTYFL